MSAFIDKFRAIRKDMWVNKPQEIKDALDKSKGYIDTFGSSFFPTLYSWEETVASRNTFLTLRKTIRENDVDLSTFKVLVGNFLDLYISYFCMTNLQDTTKLLREVAEEVPKIANKEELVELLEELIRYSGRLHYWIEPMMPWGSIIQAFESNAG